MKHENHKKVRFFGDFGQFGGVHPTPEVKICLYTKFEVNRRELENISKIENLERGSVEGEYPSPTPKGVAGPPPSTQGKGRIPLLEGEGRGVQYTGPGLARDGQGWPGLARVGFGRETYPKTWAPA